MARCLIQVSFALRQQDIECEINWRLTEVCIVIWRKSFSIKSANTYSFYIEQNSNNNKVAIYRAVMIST